MYRKYPKPKRVWHLEEIALILFTMTMPLQNMGIIKGLTFAYLFAFLGYGYFLVRAFLRRDPWILLLIAFGLTVAALVPKMTRPEEVRFSPDWALQRIAKENGLSVAAIRGQLRGDYPGVDEWPARGRHVSDLPVDPGDVRAKARYPPRGDGGIVEQLRRRPDPHENLPLARTMQAGAGSGLETHRAARAPAAAPGTRRKDRSGYLNAGALRPRRMFRRSETPPPGPS